MEYKVKDRSAKVAKRKARMPQNGVAMKRLLVERAAKARRTPAEQFEFETRPAAR